MKASENRQRVKLVRPAMLGAAGFAILGATVALASGGQKGGQSVQTMVIGSKTVRVLGHKLTPGQAAADRVEAEQSYELSLKGSRVSPKLTENFKLLRGAHAHAVSAAGTNTIASALALGASNYGANPADAIPLNIGGDAAWLVPGSTGACLVAVEGAQGAGAGCSSIALTVAGGLWSVDDIPYGSSGRHEEVLFGTVPDSVTSVTVNWVGSAPTVLPVADNAYSTPIAGHAGWTTLTLNSTDGSVATVQGVQSLP